MMSKKSPEGSRVIAISRRRLLWAVTEVVRVLIIEQANKLRIRSGEHFAATLATSVLATAPTSIDLAGGLDLVFDLSNWRSTEGVAPSWLGLGQGSFASFEVKSLPGGFRKFDAESSVGDGRTFNVPLVSVNTVLRNEGRDMILKAKEQLDKKSSPGYSKNVFLVVHFFDYPIMEFQETIIAHLLEPLSDIEGIDSAWVLWVPLDHFVVWSVEDQQWTNVLLGCIDPGDVTPDYDEELNLFEQIEFEFLKQTNNSKWSPYVFGLTVAGKDDQRLNPDRTGTDPADCP